MPNSNQISYQNMNHYNQLQSQNNEGQKFDNTKQNVFNNFQLNQIPRNTIKSNRYVK